MKILMISPVPPPAGGIASWTKRYIEKIQNSKKHDIVLVNTAVIGKRTEQMQKRNLIDEVKRTLCIFKSLNQTIKNNTDIDVVHINSACGKFGLIRDYLCAKKCKKSKLKVLVHFRCDITYMVKGKINVRLLKKLVNYSDEIITLNEISKRFIYENYKRESTIIPNFVSDTYLNLVKKEKEIKENIENVIYVGHVTKQKGCDLIYKIAPKFPDIMFKLYGYIGNEIAELQKPNNLKTFGEVNEQEIIKQLNDADVFLFPTHTEGFPNSVSEAMTLGLPIISTPVGAIPDMLEKQGGILCNVDDEENFIKALNEIKLPKVRKEMSVWNKKKVENEYSIDSIMQRIFEIYEKMRKYNEKCTNNII